MRSEMFIAISWTSKIIAWSELKVIKGIIYKVLELPSVTNTVNGMINNAD